MKKYKALLYLESFQFILNPRFELEIEASSEAEARKKALDTFSTLTEKDLKFDSFKLPYKEISYIKIEEK